MAPGTPVRSCITCRKRGAKGELVKLAATPEGVVADYLEKLPGRGAYVCIEPDCIKGALAEKQLSRAFRKKTVAPAYEPFMEGLCQALKRKAASLLGMARKSGRAACGFDASLDAIRKNRGGLLVIADDISDNTLDKLKNEEPVESGRAVRFMTRDALGVLMGRAPVAVVYVTDRGISDALRLALGRLMAINRG